MDVRSIKLVTGEEIVAELVLETPAGYHIRTPLAVHIGKNTKGEPIIGFVAWSMVQRENVELIIPETAVVCRPAPVESEVEESYVANTSSIIMPKPTSSQILHS